MQKPIQFILFVLLASLPLSAADSARDCFVISVVDQDTGRGVPLVELTTSANVAYWTDSNGLIAFAEPHLMDHDVLFSVRSDGYELPPDEPGTRRLLHTAPGGKAVLKLKRLNIAERLYRVTGEGIYRDTVRAGLKPPIQRPVLNAHVTGQDTVMMRPYRGKLYWFWGDTTNVGRPHSWNFDASGATSELPGHGGLDPSVGIDLAYFTRPDGRERAATDIPGEGSKWLFGLMTLPDASGRERLVARYRWQKRLGEPLGDGLAVFDDDARAFRKLLEFPRGAPLAPDGRPFRVREKGTDYYYFCRQETQPAIRVRADWEHFQHLESYEAFTCFEPGKGSLPERDAAGKLVWGWKRNSHAMSLREQRLLILAGKLKPSEGQWQLRDVDTGRPLDLQFGTVSWNAYRKHWIAILMEPMSTVYFVEADTPVGPWVYAKRVMKHEHYTFYWPAHHPELDQDGGRVIYFEGTYTSQFSDAPAPTPRYDYNEIMYRLRLDDPRLALPVAVYRLADGQRRMGDGVTDWSKVEAIDSFALPPQPGNKPNGGNSGNSGKSEKTWENPYSTLPIDPDARL